MHRMAHPIREERHEVRHETHSTSSLELSPIEAS